MILDSKSFKNLKQNNFLMYFENYGIIRFGSYIGKHNNSYPEPKQYIPGKFSDNLDSTLETFPDMLILNAIRNPYKEPMFSERHFSFHNFSINQPSR